jgi:hypothetical protein
MFLLIIFRLLASYRAALIRYMKCNMIFFSQPSKDFNDQFKAQVKEEIKAYNLIFNYLYAELSTELYSF